MLSRVGFIFYRTLERVSGAVGAVGLIGLLVVVVVVVVLCVIRRRRGAVATASARNP